MSPAPHAHPSTSESTVGGIRRSASLEHVAIDALHPLRAEDALDREPARHVGEKSLVGRREAEVILGDVEAAIVGNRACLDHGRKLGASLHAR